MRTCERTVWGYGKKESDDEDFCGWASATWMHLRLSVGMMMDSGYGGGCLSQ